MKKEIADKWVEALRSGKYKQGRLQLKNTNDEYCCLGILCEISGLDDFTSGAYLGNTGSLPDRVQQWAGMDSCLGTRNGARDSLVTMNDLHRYSFEKIADIIEEEYETL